MQVFILIGILIVLLLILIFNIFPTNEISEDEINKMVRMYANEIKDLDKQINTMNEEIIDIKKEIRKLKKK